MEDDNLYIDDADLKDVCDYFSADNESDSKRLKTDEDQLPLSPYNSDLSSTEYVPPLVFPSDDPSISAIYNDNVKILVQTIRSSISISTDVECVRRDFISQIYTIAKKYCFSLSEEETVFDLYECVYVNDSNSFEELLLSKSTNEEMDKLYTEKVNGLNNDKCYSMKRNPKHIFICKMIRDHMVHDKEPVELVIQWVLKYEKLEANFVCHEKPSHSMREAFVYLNNFVRDMKKCMVYMFHINTLIKQLLDYCEKDGDSYGEQSTLIMNRIMYLKSVHDNIIDHYNDDLVVLSNMFIYLEHYNLKANKSRVEFIKMDAKEVLVLDDLYTFFLFSDKRIEFLEKMVFFNLSIMNCALDEETLGTALRNIQHINDQYSKYNYRYQLCYR